MVSKVIIGILIFAYLYTSARVTYMAFKSDMFESYQKLIVTLVSWLVPILGSALISSLLKMELNSRSSETRNFFDYFFLCDALTHHTNHIEQNSGAKSEFNSGDE